MSAPSIVRASGASSASVPPLRPTYTSFKPGTSLKSLGFSVHRCRVVYEGAGGDREVEVPAAGAGQLRVQGRGLSGCLGVERNGLRAGEELFLHPQLVDGARSPQPLVQDDRRQPHSVALLDECMQAVERVARPGKRSDERRRIKMDRHGGNGAAKIRGGTDAPPAARPLGQPGTA